VTLSTLIADLVGETAEGVREASVAAARRRATLDERLTAEPTETDVDDALAALFPPLRRPPVDLLACVLDDAELEEHVSTWRPGRTAVRVGEVYLHPDLAEAGNAKARIAEFPPIERELGVPVLESVERGDGVARLTGRSVELVRRALRSRLEAERRTAAAAFADGVPTPVVESASVEVKAAFGGGEDRIDATLLDGRDRTVPPELVGTVAADLRFVSLPGGEDAGDGGGPTGTGPDGSDGGGTDEPDGRERVDPARPPELAGTRGTRRLPGRPAVRRVPGRPGVPGGPDPDREDTDVPSGEGPR